MSLKEQVGDLVQHASAAREKAVAVGNAVMSQPHLIGTSHNALNQPSEGEVRFQLLLLARVELRAALASVEDGINAVQVWRNS